MPERNKNGGGRGTPLTTGGRGQSKGAFTPKAVPKAKFTGRCKDLEGHVYDLCGTQQADQYTWTTEEISIYVAKEYNYGGDIGMAVKTLTIPEFKLPEDLPEGTTLGETKQWENQIKRIGDREEAMDKNLPKLYNLIWGQCSDPLQARLESMTEFTVIGQSMNGIELLKLLRLVAYHYEPQLFKPLAIDNAIVKYVMLKQGKHTTPADFLEQFRNNLNVLDAVGATIGPHAGILASYTGGEREANVVDKAAAREQSIAVAFLNKVDKTRYGRMLEDLKNSYLLGQNNYPTNLTDAYNLVVNWQQDPQNRVHFGAGPNDGVVFAHNTEGNDDEEGEVALANHGKSNKNHITCFKCNKRGHYHTQCPEKDDGAADGAQKEKEKTDNNTNNGTSLLVHGTAVTDVVMAHGSNDIPSNWILLDNQSTIDIFCNQNLLSNVRAADTRMKVQSTAGVTYTDMIGDLDGYGTVWYYPDGIANILSLSRVCRDFPVTFDSTNGKTFKMKRKDGSYREFIQADSGLFYSIMDEKEPEQGTALINTVDDNKSKYSKHDYMQAVLARKIQATIGRPSTADFIRIVDDRLLPNCPITKEDIMAAEHIFGPDLGAIKGKTVRIGPRKVRIPSVVVPNEILARYHKITLCGDIMFVNKIPFFITISRNIKFGTVEMIMNRQQKTILGAVTQVCQLYKTKGFQVDNILMDGEFECLRGDLAALGVGLNITSNDEHVGDIERYIRTVKERTRSIYNTLPFQQLPTRLIIEMVYTSVFWLNCFPNKNGISTSLSPRAIITGMSIDYNSHCRLEFGTYVQTHEQHDNSMASRTTGAIALRPTGNAQGGFYFMSLTTGRRISRSRWTELPTPRDVIDRIHALAQQQNTPRGLEILNRMREEIDHDNKDDDASQDNDVHIAGVDDDDDNIYNNVNYNDHDNEGADEDNNNENNDNINHDNIDIIRPEWYDNDHEHRDPFALQDRNLVAWWRRGGDPAELADLPYQEAPAQEVIEGQPNVLAGEPEPGEQEQEADNRAVNDNQIDQVEADMEA
jgi:hypothetical protein